MMADFRALCAELVEKLDELNCHYNVPSQSAMIERARAALAEPDPKRPKDVQIDALVRDCIEEDGYDLRVIVRAALARWGNQPAPPAEGEVAELILRVQRLEAMRETEKAALLDAFKQIDDLKHRIDFHYMKIHRLEDALPGQETK